MLQKYCLLLVFVVAVAGCTTTAHHSPQMAEIYTDDAYAIQSIDEENRFIDLFKNPHRRQVEEGTHVVEIASNNPNVRQGQLSSDIKVSCYVSPGRTYHVMPWACIEQ